MNADNADNADNAARRPRPGPGTGEIPHELLLDLFNSVTDGMVAVGLDLRVIAINSCALKTLGLVLPQAMGRPVVEVLRTDFSRDRSVLAETLQTGQPLADLDLLLEDNQGRHLPVMLRTALIRSAEGRILGAAATFHNLTRTKEVLRQTDRSRPFQEIITGDPNMRKLFGVLPTIARADSSVLILGETGTGKSLLVKTIHNLSPRRRGPLITVNCAALPETLLEAELFGVKAGAYTGATRDRPGRLEAANGGILFLDEIGDIPPSIQVKLLRVLQERMYERLGDIKTRTCDVRFIAATHRDLAAMVEDREFRRDLFFRINVLNLEIPPLRERKGDIPLLAQRFLDKLSVARGKTVSGISSQVLERMTVYDYPGNIRELENIIEHAFVMCEEGVIEVKHLPRELGGGAQEAGSAAGIRSKSGLPRLEAEYLLQVLRRHKGHRAAAAHELGIHRTTLQRKIRKLGLELPPEDGRALPRPN